MTITIEVRAQPGKVQELYQTLQALIPTMRKEVGCQACRVSRDVEDGDLFFLSCEWDAVARIYPNMNAMRKERRMQFYTEERDHA